MAWDDRRMDNIIASMLRLGVLVAAAVVLAGGLLYLHQNAGAAPDYRHFHGAPNGLRAPEGIAQGVAHGDARSIIQFGLLLLIATPIVRVLLCVVGFFSQKDRLYVTVSAVVLAILLYSLLDGH
jgi:uncharacterized membrane protein